jgi:peptidoglycan/xylan/chitin deacetylase (PgdA/CDA1 family)
MSSEGVSVALSVDFDATAIWRTWGAKGARALSRGEFEIRSGAPRLLKVFEKYGVPTTWFIPGHTAETWPETTKAVAKAGHEIGNHGYHHESFDQLTLEQAVAVIRKANDALERVSGQRPVGIRVPAGDFDGNLLEAMIEEGFEYDSSMMGDDFYPYWCRASDTHGENESEPGAPIDLVELPIGFITNDFNHFEFNYANPQLVGHHAPSMVEEIWKSQFDFMYRDCPGGTLIVTLHPQSIGQGGRILMLERFIEYCAGHNNVTFVTHKQVADDFRKAAASTR